MSGANGLEAIQTIIQEGVNYLNPHGLMLIEHGYLQAIAVSQLFKQYDYHEIQTWEDLNGLGRVTGARL